MKRIEEALDLAVRHEFTYNYAQPNDYHFCQDSVLFPLYVANELKAQQRLGQIQIDAQFHALDIGAGCGVLGLELAHHLPEIARFDFLEIQTEFRPYYEENVQRVLAGRKTSNAFRFIEGNYASLCEVESTVRYDLIIANPPYFFSDEGKLSPSTLRNRCRFYLDSDLKTLFQAVAHSLKPDGQAYLLIKSGRAHGRNAMRDIQLALGGQVRIARVADLRGTDIVRAYRLS